MAVGISGIFMETHPNPSEALSDGPNAVPLDNMKDLLKTLQGIDHLVKQSSVD
jgi:2-dehydro-3-deoxyphosphooctonate aldolase (KDO 8-P synthase)